MAVLRRPLEALLCGLKLLRKPPRLHELHAALAEWAS